MVADRSVAVFRHSKNSVRQKSMWNRKISMFWTERFHRKLFKNGKKLKKLQTFCSRLESKQNTLFAKNIAKTRYFNIFYSTLNFGKVPSGTRSFARWQPSIGLMRVYVMPLFSPPSLTLVFHVFLTPSWGLVVKTKEWRN